MFKIAGLLRFDNNNVNQLPPTYVRQAPIFPGSVTYPLLPLLTFLISGFVARRSLNGGLISSGGENGCNITGGI